MESMVGALMNSLSGDNLSTIGKLIGMNDNGTKALLGTAAPLLMGALAKTTAKPGAADTLMNMMGQRNLTGIADDVGGYLRNPDVAGGANIVGNLFGSQQDAPP